MEEKKHRSVWRVLDVLVCIAFVLCNCIWMLTTYCRIYEILLLFCSFVFLWSLGGHPYKLQLSKLKKRLYTIMRCILYSGAVIFTLLPWTMQYKAAWYYPVQRAMLLSCCSSEYRQEFMDDFMPKCIPSGAENYHFLYAPTILQSSSSFELSFFTDSETIAEYQKTAEEYGAKHLSLTLPEGITEEEFDLDGDISNHSNDERLILNWRQYLRENWGQDPDGMNLYLFLSGELGHTYGIYVLSEETGYFLLYR